MHTETIMLAAGSSNGDTIGTITVLALVGGLIVIFVCRWLICDFIKTSEILKQIKALKDDLKKSNANSETAISLLRSEVASMRTEMKRL